MDAIAGLILIVVTSHGQLDAEHPTGLWLEEFSIPYHAFTKAGYQVIVASPKGGKVPIDPRSMRASEAAALSVLSDTRPLSQIDLSRFKAVFFPGGHGTMFDFPSDADVRKTVEQFLNSGKPAAFVCHGPAALVGARKSDGTSIVKGRRLTGFTNSEEKAVGLDGLVPFMLQTKLEAEGATFVGKPDWQSHVITDGNLVTGQNPASSAAVAQALLALLRKESL